MDNRLIELGKRAVGCEGWRWLPGMQVMDMDFDFATAKLVWIEQTPEGARLNAVTYDGCWLRYVREEAVLPDLSDPATLGCLLALVRERHGPLTTVELSDGHRLCPNGWLVVRYDSLRADSGYVVGFGSTEAEALVHAKESDEV